MNKTNNNKVPKSKSNSFSANHSSSKCSSSGILFGKGVSAIEMKIFSLVNEVSRSKDETIAAKDHTIQLLESMLKIHQTKMS